MGACDASHQLMDANLSVLFFGALLRALEPEYLAALEALKLSRELLEQFPQGRDAKLLQRSSTRLYQQPWLYALPRKDTSSSLAIKLTYLRPRLVYSKPMSLKVCGFSKFRASTILGAFVIRLNLIQSKSLNSGHSVNITITSASVTAFSAES